jgi:hypothetical protein
MEYRSWNDELRIATCLFMRLFSKVRIVRIDAQKNVEQMIEVPIVLGTRSRALKELENPNKTISPPIFSVVKESISRDPSRMAGIYDHLQNMADDSFDYERMRGLPVNVAFTLSGLAKNELDLDQMISNWMVWFKPDVFVIWKHPKFPTVELKCSVEWEGTINYQSPVTVSQSEQEFYQFETSFVFHTWFFAGTEEADDGGKVIQKINSDATLIAVGEDGHGMNSVYAVPKTMSFTEFTESMRLGLVDNTEFGSISIPKIVGAAPGVMNSIAVNYCAETATSLTITLLEEDRTVADFDPTLFGFTDNSELLNSNTWYLQADIENDCSDVDFRYNYDLTSEISGNGANIRLESNFHSNFDWLKNYGTAPKLAYPAGVTSNFVQNWIIKNRSDSPMLQIFGDSEISDAWNPTLPAYFIYEYGSYLMLERYAIKCSDNVNAAPRIWKLFGLNYSDRKWVEVDSRDVSDWSANETKYFDVFDSRKYCSFKLLVTSAVDSQATKIEVMKFKAWRNRIGSEGPNSVPVVMSRLHCEFSDINDVGSSFSSTAILRSGEVNMEVTNLIGDSLSQVNEGEFLWFRPSLTKMSSPFFFPGRYLTFWAKGRKYGVAPTGTIKLPMLQSITYGDVFPSKVVDGSLHVLTVEGSANVIYQYDQETNTWFEIGGGSRPPFNRIFPTIDGTKPDGSLEIVKDTASVLHFPVIGSEEATYYLSGTVTSNEFGVATFQITIGSRTTTTEVTISDISRNIQIPFVLADDAVSSMEVSLLSSSAVSAITLVNYELTGKLKDGDFIVQS